METRESQPATGIIVVGVDHSPAGNHALQWAVAEASLRGARLRAVHAWDTPTPISGVASLIAPIDPELYEREAKSILNEALEEATASRPPFAIESTLQRGHPAEVLLDALDQADLLVLGSRGRGGFTGLLLGSVSQACAQHARRPIAVIPLDGGLPDSGDVVVGVDGSPGSYAALRWAIDEAAVRNVRLAVVHTWWTPYAVPPMGIAIAPIDPDVFIEQSQQLLHEMTDGSLDGATRRPADVELLPIEAPAAQGLLARAAGAGLLVVGSRGRGGFKGLLLGSVSQQCLHHAPCAIVVVPEPGRPRST
jgi:nucleotide-binding universal stress UspA family protein